MIGKFADCSFEDYLHDLNHARKLKSSELIVDFEKSLKCLKIVMYEMLRHLSFGKWPKNYGTYPLDKHYFASSANGGAKVNKHATHKYYENYTGIYQIM